MNFKKTLLNIILNEMFTEGRKTLSQSDFNAIIEKYAKRIVKLFDIPVVRSSIYSIKLHEVIALIPTGIKSTAVSHYSIMRVAGGWIYQIWDTEKQDYIREIFVPFNNEFMSV